MKPPPPLDWSASTLPTTEPLLRIENLSIAHGRGLAVRELALTLQPGGSYGLVGESGCGKSAVAYAVMGDLGEAGRITGGRILVAGRDVASLGEEERRRYRGGVAAMVYRDPAIALNPLMTVGRQLAEAVRAHHPVGRREAYTRSEGTLDAVRLKDPRRALARYPHEFSRGDLQRVVIAMALLARPRLLVLDEPTADLDLTIEAEIALLLASLAAAYGTALLYVSRDLAFIGRVCEQVGVMYAGRIVEEGTAARVLTAPEHPYTRSLLACLPRLDRPPAGRRLPTIRGQAPSPQAMPTGCSFAPRCPSVIPGRCDLAPGPALLPWRDGRVRCLRAGEIGRFDLAPPATAAAPRRPGVERLSLVGVEKRAARPRAFGTRLAGGKRAVTKAVDRVSFDLHQGEILALVGESGSGKSTIADLLVGLDAADAGSIGLDGAEIAKLPARGREPGQRRAVQIVYRSPDAALNPARTVGQTLRRAVGRLTGLSGRDAAARVAALLEMVRLPPDAARRLPEALSPGQRQRVAIARAMAGAPEVLVVEEPGTTLDVSVRAAIVNLLADLQDASGAAILLISHDLALVRHVADRVVVMYRGRVMTQGPTEEVFSAPLHPYVETLLAAAPRLSGFDADRRREPAAG